MQYTEFKDFVNTLKNYEFLIRIAKSQSKEMRVYYNDLKYIIDGFEPKAQEILEAATENLFAGRLERVTLNDTELLYDLMFFSESLPADRS